VPESAKVLSMVMQPLYLLSGVMFPVAAIPPPYRDWLVLNPLVHGLDSLRLAFAPYYHEIPGVDMNYLHAWALGLLVLGLALQVVFAKRLVSE
jgi:capsular polysaccharide transport system permease protein